MKQELQDILFNKYPTLFINRNKSIQESCMAFGIECGDGWYDLIRSVCWEIKQHEENIELRKKYNPDYLTDYQPTKFDQIKEKYGGLRIYFNGGDDHVKGVICLAEDMSFNICEVCGNKGKPNQGGWISTLCDLHRRSCNEKNI